MRTSVVLLVLLAAASHTVASKYRENTLLLVRLNVTSSDSVHLQINEIQLFRTGLECGMSGHLPRGDMIHSVGSSVIISPL